MNAPNEHDTVEPEPIEVPGDDSPADDATGQPVPDADPADVVVDAVDDTPTAVDAAADEPSALGSDDVPAESPSSADAAEAAAPEDGEVAEAAEAPDAPEAESPPEDESPAADEAADAPEADDAADGTDVSEDAESSADETDEEEEPMSMMELLLAENVPNKLQRGDLIDGMVLRVDRDQLILDIGAKQEGIVPSNDLSRLAPEVVEAIEVGDSVQAVVIRPEGREGEVLVSLFQARTVADWEKAQEYLDSGEVLELEIVGYNKGGALVGFGNLQGFVPRSHLARPGGAPAEGAEGLAALAGQTVPVKVIEVSRRKRRLIMSERLATREWRSERKKRLLEQLKEGEIRKGTVSSVADFGAFVDLGGADGLVHISELTYERGKHPRDVVSVGQEVEVYVLSIDHDRKRIGLSMKRLQADPWLTVEEEHYVGELAEARISNLSKFGAFARLEDGLEGLIHISELADHHVEHPREVVKPGQRVTVEIIAIEPDRQRIGLSVRRVPPHLRTVEEPEPEPETEDLSMEETEPEAEVEVDAAVEADAAEAEVEVEVDAAEEEDAPEAEAEVEVEVDVAEEADAPEAEVEVEADVDVAEAEDAPEAEAEVEADVDVAVEADAPEAEAEVEVDADAAEEEDAPEAEAEVEVDADAAEEEAAPEAEAEVEADAAEEEDAPEVEVEAEAEIDAGDEEKPADDPAPEEAS